MKIARFKVNDRIQYGELDGDQLRPLEGELHALKPVAGSRPIALASVKLLTPTAPTKVLPIGPGHRAVLRGGQAPETPFIFFKPVSAVTNPGDPIVFPAGASRINHEGELGIVIGRTAHKVKPEKALDYILGFTCVNDVTAGELTPKVIGSPLGSYFKAYDTFAPFGPVVASGIDARDLAMETRVNGEVRQKARSSDLIFSFEFLVSWMSQIMTLCPGDLISTGSPPGVGPLVPGDVVEVEIEGIGRLRNPVVAES